MRSALPFVFAFASVATLSVFACSSDETPAPSDAGTGSIAKPTDGSAASDAQSSSGTPTTDCSGAAGLDGAKQTAHAAEAKCSAFDETEYKRGCESQNCNSPLGCEKELKALNDCQLANPATCTSDGDVDTSSAACNAENKSLLECTISKS